MTTYSLAGIAALSDPTTDSLLSVVETELRLTWEDGTDPDLSYAYRSASGFDITWTAPDLRGMAIATGLVLDGTSLDLTFELLRFDWILNGVTRQSTVISLLAREAGLEGAQADRSVLALFGIGGTPLPPIPSESYFALFFGTQIVTSSLAEPTGALAPGQLIDVAALPGVTVTEDDVLQGLAAADLLRAGQGNDTLLGKGGNDRLEGGPGDDRLTGDEGADTLLGGADRDTVSYLDESGSLGVILSLATGSATDTHGDSDQLAEIEDVQGSGNGDRLTGDGADNQIHGYGGDDTLFGGAGADRLIGGAGDDTLDGQGGADSADYTNDGGALGIMAELSVRRVTDSFGDTDRLQNVEQVIGTKFSDRLNGGADGIALSGGRARDTIVGGVSGERLAGDEGNDLITGGAGDDTVIGGDGFDMLSYIRDRGSLGVMVDMDSATATDTHGDSDIFSEIERVEGSSFDDTLYSRASGARLDGRNGDDLMIGRDGIDTLKAGSGADTIVGHGGDDVLLGGEGGGSDVLDYSQETGGSPINADLGTRRITDTHGDTDRVTSIEILIGTAKNDKLRGDEFDNTLLGGDGRDFINGRAGADRLEGGEERDSLYGGDGDDWLLGQAADDLLEGQNGDDSLEGGGGADRLLGGAGADTLRGEEENDTLLGQEGRDTLLGGPGRDSLAGGSEGDRLEGNFGDDTLEGGSGNDTLLGGYDRDLLLGGDGNDRLGGWFQNDTLRGGAGTDTLVGGGGDDLFDFTTTARNDLDIIEDFVLGSDHLRVVGYDGITTVPLVLPWSDGGQSGAELIFDKQTVRILGLDPGADLSDILIV